MEGDNGISITPGHALIVRGASDIIDEVDEARRVTNRVVELLRNGKIAVSTWEDNTSTTQSQNIKALVNWHREQEQALDVSIHFNSVSGGTRDEGIGVEVLYKTNNFKMKALSGRVAQAISETSGLILRHKWRDEPGSKPVNNIGFLNSLQNSILVELCFVNSREDVRKYSDNFEAICQAIVSTVASEGSTVIDPRLSDVSIWAHDAWIWAIENLNMDGTRPRDFITRQEFTVLAKRIAKH